MDPRDLPMYQHPRMTLLGQTDIGSDPGSIPINEHIGNQSQTIPISDQRQAIPINDHSFNQGQAIPINDHIDHQNQESRPMHETAMSVDNVSFIHEDNPDKLLVQEHYSQLPIRNEVDNEGRICEVALPENTAHPPIDGNKDGPEEVSMETIKTEEEEDIINFMETNHDLFLKISSKEITIKQASDSLGRPYSFVYSRYEEFCDNIIGKDIVKKKKKSTLKKNGKKKKKVKKITLKGRPRSRGKIFQCEDCPAYFYTEYLIKTHSKLHLENCESHTCTACGIVFPKLGQLMRHRIESHEEALQCPHCERQFTIIASYKFHLKSHTEERPFVCHECGKGFFSKFNLECHQRQHTGERPYMCGYCEKSFTTLNILKTHQYVHTGRENQPKNFECEECGKKYVGRDDLQQHMNTHTGARPYACDQCDARFNFKANLTRHQMTHTGVQPYKCDLCPAAFYQPIDLQRHKVSHSGLKPFKCDQCDYSCTREHNLKFHKNTHTGETPFKCDFYGCTAEYARPSSLKHHKLQHGPPPPQTCKVCNETLQDRVALKRHMMIHTGEKPQSCEQCFKVFFDKSSLKRHMYTHMYKPPGHKTKQVRQGRKNPVVKKPVPAVTEQKRWPTEYQAPVIAENGYSSIAQSWTINAEDTNSQTHFQPFATPQYSNLAAASQYSNLVNNAWPAAMDPDELRRRLLSSFK